MKKIFSFLLFFNAAFCYAQPTEDWYGPVTISFHGFICNRPTNDDGLGMDGVSDEVSVHFWNWSSVATNRASYNGLSRIYGEDFLLPDRIKAGTATINGGIKAGDSYYRENVYGDENPLSLSKYAIITTFCSQNTVIALLPSIWERDNGTLGVTPIQDFGVATNRAFNEMPVKQKFWDFRDSYVYNDNNPCGFILPGKDIGLDANYVGMFTANKNKLASRPIGLLPNWDYSSQVMVLTSKTIKIISEKDFGYGRGIVPVIFNEETMGNSFGHGNYILLLRVVADIKLRNPVTPPASSSDFKLGVSFASSLMPVNDRYELELNGSERIIIDTGHKTAYFSKRFHIGESFRVRQISGPRACNFSTIGAPDSIAQGIISNSDLLINLGCAAPPLTLLKMNITGIETGESFQFADNYGRRYSYPFSVIALLGGFPAGDPLLIKQTGGPRACVITPASGVVPNDPLTIQCDCRKSPGTTSPSATTKLKGVFTSVPGTKISLQLNNTETLSITQTNAGNTAWQTTNFSFPKSYPVGTAYSVSIKSPNPGCIIYENAEGSVSDSTVIGIRCDKGIDLVSRSTDNKILGSYYESFDPVIGGKYEDEGRYVAFGSSAKGIDGSSGKFRQIFWRDRKSGITKMVSRTTTGEEGNGNSQMAAISADGKTVVFESYATNLSSGDNTWTRDVYAWNEQTNVVELISKTPEGMAGNGESYEPVVSGDGSVIAYTSNASDIVKLGPVFSTPNVYVNNGGSTLFITKDYETGNAVGGYSPSISEDGTRIAFCAYTYKLVKNDNNNLWDIFLWQADMPGLKRISFTSTGDERNQGTESSSRVVAPAISGNGRFVAYATTASNMVPGDDNAMQDVFICNTSGGDVRRMSADGNGDSPISQGEKIGISYDGKWISYNTNADNLGVLKGNIVLQNTVSGQVIPVTTTSGGSTARPMLSRGGAYVVAGCSEKYDKRFPSSGIFVFFPRTN